MIVISRANVIRRRRKPLVLPEQHNKENESISTADLKNSSSLVSKQQQQPSMDSVVGTPRRGLQDRKVLGTLTPNAKINNPTTTVVTSLVLSTHIEQETTKTNADDDKEGPLKRRRNKRKRNYTILQSAPEETCDISAAAVLVVSNENKSSFASNETEVSEIQGIEMEEATQEPQTKVISRKNVKRRRRVQLAEERNEQFSVEARDVHNPIDHSRANQACSDADDERTPVTPVAPKDSSIFVAVGKSPRTPCRLTPRTPMSRNRNRLMTPRSTSRSTSRRTSFFLSPNTVDIMKQDGRYVQTPVFDRTMPYQNFVNLRKYKRKSTEHRPSIALGISVSDLVQWYTLTELRSYCTLNNSKSCGTKQELAERIVSEVIPRQGPSLLTTPMAVSKNERHRNASRASSKYLYFNVSDDEDIGRDDDNDYGEQEILSEELQYLRFEHDPNYVCRKRSRSAIIQNNEEEEVEYSLNFDYSKESKTRLANLSVLDYYQGLKLYTPELMKQYCRQHSLIHSGNRQTLKKRILSYIEKTGVWKQ